MNNFSFLLLAAAILLLALQPVSAVNMCIPFKTRDGVFKLDRPGLLAEFFPSLWQHGIADGNFSWSFSLCDPSYPVAGMVCNAFMSEGIGYSPSCSEMVFTKMMSNVTYDETNKALNFVYTTKDEYNVYIATFECKCDKLGSGLKIPSNSYQFNGEWGPHHEQIILMNFNVTSPGCCPFMPYRK